MRNRTAILSMATALLLIGAGCATPTSRQISAPDKSADSVEQDTPSSEAKMEAKNDELKMEIKGNVTADSTAAAVTAALDAEKMTDDSVEKDAAELDADKSGIDAVGSSSYDVK